MRMSEMLCCSRSLKARGLGAVLFNLSPTWAFLFEWLYCMHVMRKCNMIWNWTETGLQGLQLCSQIYKLTISNGTLNARFLNTFPGLMVRSSAMMIGIIWKRKVKTSLMAQSSPLNSNFFSTAHLYSMVPSGQSVAYTTEYRPDCVPKKGQTFDRAISK